MSTPSSIPALSIPMLASPQVWTALHACKGLDKTKLKRLREYFTWMPVVDRQSEDLWVGVICHIHEPTAAGTVIELAPFPFHGETWATPSTAVAFIDYEELGRKWAKQRRAHSLTPSDSFAAIVLNGLVYFEEILASQASSRETAIAFLPSALEKHLREQVKAEGDRARSSPAEALAGFRRKALERALASVKRIPVGSGNLSLPKDATASVTRPTHKVALEAPNRYYALKAGRVNLSTPVPHAPARADSEEGDDAAPEDAQEEASDPQASTSLEKHAEIGAGNEAKDDGGEVEDVGGGGEDAGLGEDDSPRAQLDKQAEVDGNAQKDALAKVDDDGGTSGAPKGKERARESPPAEDSGDGSGAGMKRQGSKKRRRQATQDGVDQRSPAAGKLPTKKTQWMSPASKATRSNKDKAKGRQVAQEKVVAKRTEVDDAMAAIFER